MRLSVDVFFILLVSLSHGLNFDGSNTCSYVVDTLNAHGLPDLHEIHTVNAYIAITYGGNDMYDVNVGGNYVKLAGLSGPSFLYITGCQSANQWGRTYVQDFVDYFQVTVVDEMQDDRFDIYGALDTDSEGHIAAGEYECAGFRTFWKQVCGKGTGSHTVGHLWLTNAPNAWHSYSTDTGSDSDQLGGVQGYGVIYILFSVRDGHCYDEDVMQGVVRSIMGVTAQPSYAPQTSWPTISPSDNPTNPPPTSDPTISPSDTPTKTPVTSEPTISPSDNPTKTPVTSEPTISPSDYPTKVPVTSEPTLFPTLSTPTSSPATSEPTDSSAPSDVPTSAPSVVPTTAPTLVPTFAPSVTAPTHVPTSAPSETLGYQYITFLNQFDDVIAQDDEVPQFLLECSAYLYETFTTQVYCDLIQSTAAGTAYIRIAGPTSQISHIAQLINGFGMVIDGYPPLYTQTTGTPEPTTEAPTAFTCSEDEVMVEVFVIASVSWAYDIKWSISDTCKNDVGYADGPSDGEPDVHHTTQCCLPPTTYTLECTTWFSSGWEDSKLAVNGVFYCDSIEQDEAHLLNLCPNGGDCTGISTTSMSTTPTIVIGTGGGSSSSGTIVIPTTGGDSTTGTTGDDEGNSCFFAHDGECDEHWGGCDPGTDCTDCGNCQAQGSDASSFPVGVIALFGLLLLL